MTLKKVISLFILLMTMGMLSYYYFPEQKLVSDVVIDSLVVHKSKRKMIAYSKGQSIKTYTISLVSVFIDAASPFQSASLANCAIVPYHRI